jgi:hypothetical protein
MKLKHKICEFASRDERVLGPESFARLVDWAEARQNPERSHWIAAHGRR